MRLVVPLEIDPAALAGWRRGVPVALLCGETMGTTWSVRMAAPDADADAVASALEDRLECLLAQMSHWRADSLLGRFNVAPAGTWLSLPADFACVMEAALAVAGHSGGAFDPAIGELVNLWGFGPPGRCPKPSLAQVREARRRGGYRRLSYDAASRRLLQPGGAKLDLSGIAKGYAVDALMQVLRGHGCGHALVEIGGELAGSGIRPDGDPWWVDLETPADRIAPLRIALHQLSVATSGDYVRGQHTLDPRTGQPAAHSIAVSVIHPSAMLADTWATALGVLEPAQMRQMTVRHDLMVRAILRSDEPVEWISPALQRLLCEAAEGEFDATNAPHEKILQH